MFDLMGTSGLSAQTWHLGFGGSSASVTKIFFLGFGCRLRYTVLHLSSLPCRIFKASITMQPAITALVVAIAGMMLPAMLFTSNLLLVEMLKMCIRMLAQAVTKLSAGRSSLSQTKKPSSSPFFFTSLAKSSFSSVTALSITVAHSAMLHSFWSSKLKELFASEVKKKRGAG